MSKVHTKLCMELREKTQATSVLEMTRGRMGFDTLCKIDDIVIPWPCSLTLRRSSITL